jgi:hypothetical protein
MSVFEKVKAIEEELAKAREKRKAGIDKIIEESHPLKIGDIVTVNSGYSWEGKQMEVVLLSIEPSTWRDEFTKVEWKAVGKVLRKDGSKSQNYGKWKQGILE